jgi:CRP/FNR family transcriptional regulator, cyclic AMP receptor protein
MTTVRAVFINARKTRDVAAGETIFLEGEGDYMYGVVSGAVEMRIGDHTVETAGEGDVFGEMALIDKSKRAATAIATAPTSLAMIDQREFLFLVHETPTFAIQVMSSLADRLRKLDTTL